MYRPFPDRDRALRQVQRHLLEQPAREPSSLGMLQIRAHPDAPAWRQRQLAERLGQ